ncbi:MAG: aminoacyl-histidine dipeptidase [Clostridia bacterium]|nr:aminoacyl-histidine dipeptidase [Clostridia bacterium]
MLELKSLNSARVFDFFKTLSAIPHGSGNMKGIADYCEGFAKEHNLKYIRDAADNVVIFKNGTDGYENSDPVILQGHLDMVCQKTPDCNIDFEKDGLDLYIDGDFIKAHGTTLGADNGIAVAMVLSILESNSIAHPPIEAVFTVDEEIGMLGAMALDMSQLHGRQMINLDSEEDNVVTVSCAGGSDFKLNIPLNKIKCQGAAVTIDINGLLGGHSGVEINKNRVNANMIAGRVLNALDGFEIISINGGDKPNAIPNRCVIELCVKDADAFCVAAKQQLEIIKAEIADRECGFTPEIVVNNNGKFDCFDKKTADKLIYTLLCVPNGITEMSADIKGLVQTSLNLGVLMTDADSMTLHFALRSNKKSALAFLEQRLCAFFDRLDWHHQEFGHYPPWEYKADSKLRDIYCDIYKETFGKSPSVEAIHAGLECGVFASALDGIDCIAIGPTMYDVHTVNERLSISSTENFYNLILKTLTRLK